MFDISRIKTSDAAHKDGQDPPACVFEGDFLIDILFLFPVNMMEPALMVTGSRPEIIHNLH
jgi:hypothetical protein